MRQNTTFLPTRWNLHRLSAQEWIEQLPPWTMYLGIFACPLFMMPVKLWTLWTVTWAWTKMLKTFQLVAQWVSIHLKETMMLPNGKVGTRGRWACRNEAYGGDRLWPEVTSLQAIIDATAAVKGEAKPYAITGSLPLVREMQAAGFDVQITGYGLSKTYHADNEYSLLSDMVSAYKIVLLIVSQMNIS